MTTVTQFRDAIATQYGPAALHQALAASNDAKAAQFKSYNQNFMDRGEDAFVPPAILTAVTKIVAQHVRQQAVQAAVIAQPLPMAQVVVPVAQVVVPVAQVVVPVKASRCSSTVVAAATAVAGIAIALTAKLYLQS